jgi:multicomponent Na+:H+ antiporter subunit D
MPSPALLVAVPLVAAAFLAGLRKLIPRWLADSLAILVALANLILASVWTIHALGHTSTYWFGNWFPRGHMVLGIGFVMDAAGCGIATLAALLTFLALVYSWRFVSSGGGHYHPLMLVFLAAMCGFAVTGDIFNLFVFFELMSTAAFALCGLKTNEPAPLAGAFNFAVTNTIGAFLVLTGIAFLYAATGALNMAQIGELLTGRHDRLVTAAFAFIACGFLIKAAAVPFHLWLPDAHAVAPTPVCVLFSGVMVEFGLFGLMRVYATVFQGSFTTLELHLAFALLGALSAIWGGIMCFAEHHLKRLLAFSTISHTGLMILGFGLWRPEALYGLFIYLVGHALVKAGLFFTAGILLHRLRTMSEPALFGRGKILPWTAAVWFAGGLGLAGAPGFALMVGESQMTAHAVGIWGVFLVSEVFTAAAVFRVGFRVFIGWGDAGPVDKSAVVDELPETKAEHEKIYWFLFSPAAFCMLTALGITFVPVLSNGAYSAAVWFMDFRNYSHAVYSSVAPVTLLTAPPIEWSHALFHGSLTAVIAILFALWAVFHRAVPRAIRWPSHMEGSMRAIRAVQSGHVGDYAAWITFGVAVFGGTLVWLAR